MSASLNNYLTEISRLFGAMELSDTVGLPLDSEESLKLLWKTKATGASVFVVGNGGSAAIASHLQNDLCKAAGIPSMVFTEQPLLTALSNDDGYETAYESLVRLWSKPGDVLIAISSSGCSENIIRAVRAAKAAGCRVITLSGFGLDNPLRALGDINYYVPSQEYGPVEVVHATICQYFTDALLLKSRKAD